LSVSYNRHASGVLSIKCGNSILRDSIRYSIFSLKVSHQL